MAKVFFDSNALFYLLSKDAAKADRAEESPTAGGGIISVQGLNEFAAIARRKVQMGWPETRLVLSTIRATCQVVPLTTELHENGIGIADRYGYTDYDSLIIAAAIDSDCDTLYSEDSQDRQIFGSMQIANPFKGL